MSSKDTSQSTVLSSMPVDGISSQTVSDKQLNVNTLRPRQNGRYFPDDIFKCIFLNENVWIFKNLTEVCS